MKLFKLVVTMAITTVLSAHVFAAGSSFNQNPTEVVLTAEQLSEINQGREFIDRPLANHPPILGSEAKDRITLRSFRDGQNRINFILPFLDRFIDEHPKYNRSRFELELNQGIDLANLTKLNLEAVVIEGLNGAKLDLEQLTISQIEGEKLIIVAKGFVEAANGDHRDFVFQGLLERR